MNNDDLEPSSETAMPSNEAALAQTSTIPLPTLSNDQSVPSHSDSTGCYARPTAQQPVKDQYYKLLDKAREDATTARCYSTTETRNLMREEVTKRCEGKIPYPWQTDIAEAILLGLDSVLVAGTGAGKTLPFVMPLLADKTEKTKIIIVSTLNELERDQADRFKKMDLNAAAVNKEDYTNELHADLVSEKCRIIITSPEMILEHHRFSKLIRDPIWMQDVVATVIDEAHCIVHWGDKFRQKFAEVEKVRSFMAITRPILIASATMAPELLAEVQRKLSFSRSKTFTINLGNDRSNVTQVIMRMKSANNLSQLDFILDEARSDGELIQTIIYFNSRELAREGWLHLRRKAPESYRKYLGFITAARSPEAKKLVMREFRKGNIHILCATEVAGMGMDIPDIRRVVQFKVPKTISEWHQHAGRAGRDGKPTVAILLVEPSVFQTVKCGRADIEESEESSSAGHKRKFSQDEGGDPDAEHEDYNSDIDDDQEPEIANPEHVNNTVEDEALDDDGHDTDDDTDAAANNEKGNLNTKYRKSVDPPLRALITAELCRRPISDKHFNNPCRDPRRPPTVPCCDNCIETLRKGHQEALCEADLNILNLMQRLRSESLDEDLTDQISAPIAIMPRKRLTQRRIAIRDALYTWRLQLWTTKYSYCSWGVETLLPKASLMGLVYSDPTTVQDILAACPDWLYAARHGEDIIRYMKKAADEYQECLRKDKEVTNAAKRQKTAQAKAVRNQERNEKRKESRRIAKDNTLPKVSASSSKYPGMGSFDSNMPLVPTQPTSSQHMVTTSLCENVRWESHVTIEHFIN